MRMKMLSLSRPGSNHLHDNEEQHQKSLRPLPSFLSSSGLRSTCLHQTQRSPHHFHVKREFFLNSDLYLSVNLTIPWETAAQRFKLWCCLETKMWPKKKKIPFWTQTVYWWAFHFVKSMLLHDLGLNFPHVDKECNSSVYYCPSCCSSSTKWAPPLQATNLSSFVPGFSEGLGQTRDACSPTD